jgi:hypothetical protein
LPVTIMEIAMHHSRRRPPTPDRQADLFLTHRLPSADSAPGWNALPDQTQHAVTGLMTRLLLAHADGKTAELEGAGDER